MDLQSHDILSFELSVSLDLVHVDGELVGRKGSGLVRAEDGDSGQLFDGRDSSDDGLMLGELLSADGHGDGEDGGHGNGDTSDQKDEDVVEAVTVRVAEVGVEDKDLKEDEGSDRYHAEESDLGENPLEMSSRIVVLSDEGRSSSEEGVGSCGDYDPFSFSLLAGRSAETRRRAQTY